METFYTDAILLYGNARFHTYRQPTKQKIISEKIKFKWPATFPQLDREFVGNTEK